MSSAVRCSALAPAHFDLSGQTALVVGGYGAIGWTISEALARFGADTFLAGRNAARAEEAAAEFRAQGLKATAEVFDARDLGALDTALSRIMAKTNRIDLLINCLGHQREQSLLEVSEDAFDEVYSTNLKAAMFLGQRVARQQRISGSKGGSHVHLLSLRSQSGLLDRGYSSFCASKGGLGVLIKQHAAELGALGIRVNGVAPGAVHTRKNHQAVSDPGQFAKMTDRIPLKRLAEPADVAAAVLFLCSAAASFITGHILVVDGGLSSCA
jgi:NAD(P)-dependent dehydrogenase (short-subunit alcohol dehydrogenase family)